MSLLFSHDPTILLLYLFVGFGSYTNQSILKFSITTKRQTKSSTRVYFLRFHSLFPNSTATCSFVLAGCKWLRPSQRQRWDPPKKPQNGVVYKREPHNHNDRASGGKADGRRHGFRHAILARQRSLPHAYFSCNCNLYSHVSH
jgi:hypothetical protein